MRMTEPMDWGRLQQVSRAFLGIVRENCWTQLTELNLRTNQSRAKLEINKQKWLAESDAKLILFLKELAKKAKKIQTISLVIAAKTDTCEMALKYLTSASLQQVKKMNLHVHFYEAVPLLADFISSVSGTVESLGCKIYSDHPELHQAFRNCRALKTIEMENPGLVESLLYGKTQLQMVQLIQLPGHPFLAASVLLDTQAHLTTCLFEENGHFLFESYIQAVQDQNLMSDHPLKTLKTLNLCRLPGVVLPFHLFPDLEEIELDFDSGPFDIGVLNAVIGQFLGQYGDGPGNRRLLNIQMRDFNPLPALARTVEQMISPVASAELKGPRTQELTFVRGKVTAKASIEQLHWVQSPIAPGILRERLPPTQTPMGG